jgi:hypothetical protein
MKLKSLGFLRRGGRRRTLLGVDKEACALLSGLGLGVGLMYFLDGNNGKRRRTTVADKLGSWARTGACAVSDASKDARNRLKGVAHEAAKKLHPSEAATGGQLAGQIRSRMGRLVSHPHAIDVSVEDDRVVLEGPILTKEADVLVSAVRSMPGVGRLDDRLSRFESAEGVPALQGESRGDGGGVLPGAAWEGS